MKLINDFYQIISTEQCEGEYRCKVQMNPDHALYRVHFPGNPVTPGVCLVQMATEILEQKYQKTLLFCKADNIKFKKTVGSNEAPSFVFIKELVEGNQLSVRVSIEDGEVQFVKMSLRYNVA